MTKNTSKTGKLLIWIAFVVIPLAIVYGINHKVFQVPYTSAHTGKEHLEFPLSKVTVPMKKDVMMNVFKEKVRGDDAKVCAWAYAEAKSNGLMLLPREGKEADFLKHVNENGQAAKIAELYGQWNGQEHGFLWDTVNERQFFMPECNNNVVLVPTWLLYVLVDQNLL